MFKMLYYTVKSYHLDENINYAKIFAVHLKRLVGENKTK